jgi:hypothetical protein
VTPVRGRFVVGAAGTWPAQLAVLPADLNGGSDVLLYEPRSGTWTTAAVMPGQRTTNYSGVAPAWATLAAGDVDGDGLSEVYLYAPADGTTVLLDADPGKPVQLRSAAWPGGWRMEGYRVGNQLDFTPTVDEAPSINPPPVNPGEAPKPDPKPSVPVAPVSLTPLLPGVPAGDTLQPSGPSPFALPSPVLTTTTAAPVFASAAAYTTSAAAALAETLTTSALEAPAPSSPSAAAPAPHTLGPGDYLQYLSAPGAASVEGTTREHGTSERPRESTGSAAPDANEADAARPERQASSAKATTDEATEITIDSAVLHGAIGNASPTASAGFLWGMNTPLVMIAWVDRTAENGAIAQTLTGLLPDTQYYFRTVVQDSEGRRVLGPVKPFKTAAGAALADSLAAPAAPSDSGERIAAAGRP